MKLSNIYKAKFKKFGVSPKSLLWKSRGAAHQRFREFWREIDFSGKSVLDIGCGFGEFGNFLTKRYNNVAYKGVDITDSFIESGHKLYPHLSLEVANFLTITKAERFDIVVASGVLNSNYQSDNMNYRTSAIKKMFELTDGVLAFNMLGAHPQPKNNNESNIWYADSLKILEYCMSLTRRVVFRSSYHPRDFTIFMYKVKK